MNILDILFIAMLPKLTQIFNVITEQFDHDSLIFLEKILESKPVVTVTLPYLQGISVTVCKIITEYRIEVQN